MTSEGVEPALSASERRRDERLSDFRHARAFIGALAILALLIGLVIRARIHLSTPLPSDQPLRWCLFGTAQDLVVISIAALAALLIARWSARIASWLLASFLFIVAILHFVWSEVVVFFGHSLRPEDLQTELHPRLFIGSAQGRLLLMFLGGVLLYWVLVAALFVSRHRFGRLGVSAVRCASAAVAGLILLLIPQDVHLADTSRNPLFAIVGLLRSPVESAPGGAVIIPPPSLPRTSVRELAPRAHQPNFFDDRYPLAYNPPPRPPGALTLPAGSRPNIVFFLMEGIRTEEVAAYGGKPKGLTPNLDRLAAGGIRFDDVYSIGAFTPEGEIAVWYGLLASPYEILIRTRPEVELTGLPEMLRKSGYLSFVWVHPGDQTLYLSSRFYLHRGFTMFDGRDYAATESRTNWGYSDKALVRRGLQALDHVKEPFAGMLLTVSNHHPFQLPSDAESEFNELPEEKHGQLFLPGTRYWMGLHLVPMLRTVHYTDESLGYLMEEAKKRPWFARTIFVILGDHGATIVPEGGVHSVHHFGELRHRIPLVIYSPMLKGGTSVAGPSTQADILPTILGLLGDRGPRAGTGRDLFDPSTDDPERPLFAWDGKLLTIITRDFAYHATIPPLAAGIRLTDEILVDRRVDPLGLVNLAQQEPQRLETMRRHARIYLEVYPAVLAEGRSGLPR